MWSGLRQVAAGMPAPSFLPHSLESILYSLKEPGGGGGGVVTLRPYRRPACAEERGPRPPRGAPGGEAPAAQGTSAVAAQFTGGAGPAFASRAAVGAPGRSGRALKNSAFWLICYISQFVGSGYLFPYLTVNKGVRFCPGGNSLGREGAAGDGG